MAINRAVRRGINVARGANVLTSGLQGWMQALQLDKELQERIADRDYKKRAEQRENAELAMKAGLYGSPTLYQTGGVTTQQTTPVDPAVAAEVKRQISTITGVPLQPPVVKPTPQPLPSTLPAGQFSTGAPVYNVNPMQPPNTTLNTPVTPSTNVTVPTPTVAAKVVNVKPPDVIGVTSGDMKDMWQAQETAFSTQKDLYKMASDTYNAKVDPFVQVAAAVQKRLESGNSSAANLALKQTIKIQEGKSSRVAKDDVTFAQNIGSVLEKAKALVKNLEAGGGLSDGQILDLYESLENGMRADSGRVGDTLNQIYGVVDTTTGRLNAEQKLGWDSEDIKRRVFQDFRADINKYVPEKVKRMRELSNSFEVEGQ